MATCDHVWVRGGGQFLYPKKVNTAKRQYKY
jgi:hypothetical protein